MLGGIFPHFKRIRFCPQTNKLLNYFSTRLVFHHSNYFLIYTCLNSRRVISSTFTSIKPRFDITRNVYVKVVSPDFVDERIGIGIQQFSLTSILRLYVIIMTRAQLLPRMADRTRAVKTTLFTSALRRIFSNR